MSELNKIDPNDLLRMFLDGELSSDQEQEALHIIADREDLRSLLKFERQLGEAFYDAGSEVDIESFSVPEGFSDEVMGAVHSVEKEKAADKTEELWLSFKERVAGWFTPKEFTIRPAFVYALPVILLGAVLFVADFSPDEPEQFDEMRTEVVDDGVHSDDQVWIRFVYIDEEAEEMAVAGNFSDWEPIEMSRQVMDGNQVWTGLIPVERGEHHYMFVRNGEDWITDPLAELQRDDGFGNKNAVIYL